MATRPRMQNAMPNTRAKLPPPPSAHGQSVAEKNFEFVNEVLTRSYVALLIGSGVLVVAALIVALAAGLRVQLGEWAVPTFNLVGGLLLAGGLMVVIGQQLARLVVPLLALLVVAVPYVAAYKLVGEEAAMTAGVAGGLWLLFTVAMVVRGAARTKTTSVQPTAAAAAAAATAAATGAAPDASAPEREGRAAVVLGYLGALSLLVAFLADVLPDG